MQRKRLFRVSLTVLCLVLAGLLYGGFVSRTGIGIPCVFHELTGFKCPGCGVTRMCVALMQLDFVKAYRENPMLFLLIPILLLVFLPYVAGYIRNGRWEMSRFQNGLLYLSIVLLIGFGILRNILV